LLRQKENIRNIIALAEKNDLVLSRGAFDRDWWKDGISTTLYLRDTGTSFDVVLSSDYSFYVSDFDDDDKRFFENLLINNSFNYFNDIKSHSIKLSINNDIAEFSFILSDGDNYYSYIKDQVKFCNKKNDYKGVGLNNTFLSRINNAVVDKDNNIVYYCPDDISIRTFW
jgi:hypothetical protein